MDPWAVLGVPRGASQAEIKAAFREKSKLCHPDMVPEPGRADAERAFKQLSEAYSRLTLAHSPRLTYHAARPAAHARAWAPGGGPPRRFGLGLLIGLLFGPAIFTTVFVSNKLHNYDKEEFPDGLFSRATSNPFLREDLRPAVTQKPPCWLPVVERWISALSGRPASGDASAGTAR